MNQIQDPHVLRGRALTFVDRPKDVSDTEAYCYWPDAAIAIEDGKIIWAGDYDDRPKSVREWPETDHRPYLLVPGFIDPHAHYPQTGIIASYGAQLLDWLQNFTFPTEQKCSDLAYSDTLAGAYISQVIANGVTSVATYCTSHPNSVTAFFEQAQKVNMCAIAGKVLMDHGAPEALLDTPQRGYDESAELIETWHGRGRNLYAITPRFAVTSTAAQLEQCQALVAAYPDCYVQTHLSENHEEIELVSRLFPNSLDYTHVYEQYGLLGPKTLLGHCVHLSEREIGALCDTGSVAVFCPSSNLFLGSGLFDYDKLDESGVRIAIASDIGGGTSISMLQTTSDAYKICQLNGFSLNPLESLYRLTLGNSRAVGLDHDIGSLQTGRFADIAVLDAHSTPAMALRMEGVEDIIEEVFVLQMMGDDRAVQQTYIAGVPRKVTETP